ncbi:cyclic AMP-responsive element-binding protein 3-like protein 2 [Oncorhynchus masou masou]|uniref:cyclic AMP-responsive element-binding protein 3-like protein 2 n=1 Tax=Oncorhynchus masou masou TaxID=90313 RepID=UPI003183CFA2
MEILDSTESFLHWDRNLSELSEPGETEHVLYSTHFTDLLDDFSQDALLGQLLSDPFLSGREGEAMDEGDDFTPSSPLPPHIQAEHSYSLCGDSRPQSPVSHLPGEQGSDAESDGENWSVEQEEQMEVLLCDSPALLPTLTLSLAPEGHITEALAPPAPKPNPQTATQGKTSKAKEIGEIQIKLEPHEVDQFLNLSPKGLESLQMPPTPPSSHSSDSEGCQSPVHASTPQSPSTPSSPLSPAPTQAGLKVSQRTPSSLSNSPLLTAPHKLQGSGPLLLTEEERRTLVAEGYPVPTKLPLSKAEEKALKKIRRKIKNKISAQESRRKKKEYMDALEKKVENCSNENSELRRKLENLECTNKTLIQQLHSLQAVVAGKVPRSCKVTGTQTSSCLMVVVLCFAVFLGSFYSSLGPCSSITETGLSRDMAMQESYTATVKSRSLLSYEERGLDEPHLLGLGGDYPDQLERPTVVMAAWHSEKKQQKGEESHRAETRPPFSNSSDTNPQKPLLLDLHRSLEQRVNDSAKIIELERTVNETS